jgi:hypothetical protein
MAAKAEAPPLMERLVQAAKTTDLGVLAVGGDEKIGVDGATVGIDFEAVYGNVPDAPEAFDIEFSSALQKKVMQYGTPEAGCGVVREIGFDREMGIDKADAAKTEASLERKLDAEPIEG